MRSALEKDGPVERRSRRSPLQPGPPFEQDGAGGSQEVPGAFRRTANQETDHGARRHFGQLRSRGGRRIANWNQAVAQLEEAVEVCGNCRSKADLHKNLGLIYCRSGNLEKGERELRTAQRLKAGDPDITKSLRIIDELKNRKSQP